MRENCTKLYTCILTLYLFAWETRVTHLIVCSSVSSCVSLKCNKKCKLTNLSSSFIQILHIFAYRLKPCHHQYSDILNVIIFDLINNILHRYGTKKHVVLQLLKMFLSSVTYSCVVMAVYSKAFLNFSVGTYFIGVWFNPSQSLVS